MNRAGYDPRSGRGYWKITGFGDEAAEHIENAPTRLSCPSQNRAGASLKKYLKISAVASACPR